MRALRTIRLRLRSLRHGPQVEQELSEELRDHLERQIDLYCARGLSEKDARAAALREFGNVPLIQEQVRDTYGVRWLDDLRADTRYALRSMRRSRMYAIVAATSLALGIGANTAIFSLLDQVLLKKLPVEDPDRLVFIDNSGGKSGGTSAPPYPGFELMRDHQRTLSGLAAFNENRFKVTIDGTAEQVSGLTASGTYFDVLGVRPVYGRLLTVADDTAFQGEGDAAAVISYGFWTRRFARDPGVLGRRLLVGTNPATIVGVTPPGFTGLQPGAPVDITVPIRLEGRQLQSRTLWWMTAFGRLKPGVTVDQARADLETLFDTYMVSIGQPREKRGYFSHIELVPAARGLNGLRREFSEPLWILMGVVVVVLLIGCANVANLLVARASARQGEIAVRLSLGAGRWRLVRQLVTEGAVLVAIGTLAGLVVARWGVSLLIGLIASRRQGTLLSVDFDVRVLLFTVVIAALTTVLFSLAPALQATRVAAAKPGATGATAPAGPRALRRSLVLVQVSLSVALLFGAALFGRTLSNLRDVDMGFRSDGVLTMQVEATLPRLTEEPRTPERRLAHARVGAIWEEAIARVRQLPGVQSAGVGGMSPFTGRDRGVAIQVLGGPPLADEDRGIHINQISAGYLEAMGIDVLSGRAFTPQDRGGAPRVAILNESAARKYFGAGSAIGALIRFPGQWVEDPYEVVGVVRDVRYENLRTPDERMAYLPAEQSLEPLTSMIVAVRGTGTGSGDALLPSVRQTMAAAVPGGFVTRVSTLDEQLDGALVRERLLSLLAASFGGLALMLAWIGLYGVMAYGVVRRTREIATRVAIGAPHRAVIWMVVRETLVLVAAGGALGMLTALAAGRYVRTQLFGVTPADPVASIVAILLLFVVAAAAAYLPARRATRIDPMLALRME
jgi:predicted permease